MPRLVIRNGRFHQAMGADEGGAGGALLMFAAIAAGVTLYWWEVEGKAKRKARRRSRG
jgi:hypothetical protein